MFHVVGAIVAITVVAKFAVCKAVAISVGKPAHISHVASLWISIFSFNLYVSLLFTVIFTILFPAGCKFRSKIHLSCYRHLCRSSILTFLCDWTIHEQCGTNEFWNKPRNIRWEKSHVKLTTYNFKHWDLVQLQGFLCRVGDGELGVLKKKREEWNFEEVCASLNFHFEKILALMFPPTRLQAEKHCLLKFV